MFPAHLRTRTYLFFTMWSPLMESNCCWRAKYGRLSAITNGHKERTGGHSRLRTVPSGCQLLLQVGIRGERCPDLIDAEVTLSTEPKTPRHVVVGRATLDSSTNGLKRMCP